jgi:hypothetical protein
MGACGVNQTIDFDVAETYLSIADPIILSHLSSNSKLNIKTFQSEYNDTAVEYVLGKCDQVNLFLSLNRKLRECHFILSHATRLTQDDLASLETDGFFPLKATGKVNRLKKRIMDYCKTRNKSFDLTKYENLVEKHVNRDAGRAYFSLSRDFHKHDCTDYLHFGSEFEQVVVVWLLSRYERRLLKADSKAAFIIWEVLGDTLNLVHTHEEILQCLESGDRPELASRMINNWVLWKSGNEDKIESLNKDYTVTFKMPFPVRNERIEWVEEKSIGRMSQ